MKKEQLEKRLAELMATKEQLIANANACQGAINELQRIINEFPKEMAYSGDE